MLYLVTGGAGFIGSNIVEELLKRGERVRVLDNFSTGKRSNLLPFLGDIELVEGDIRSYHIVHEAVRGAEVVLHQAALPSVPRSIADPITTHEVNTNGTLNVLAAAREHAVRRVVFASSSSIYGDSAELPKHEGMIPNPLSPYAVSKLAGEKYMQVYYRLYGLETVSLRYFNVFGPRQNPDSQYSAVIPRFIAAVLAGRSPVVYGDGEQTRDFTYVANVVAANISAAEAPAAAGEVMNIACRERVSINRLIDDLRRLTGREVQPVYEAPRLGDVRHSFADISKAEALLGYRNIVRWETGLRMTVESFAEASFS
ncbi:MAG: SDR family oxidoreductase [Bacteroidota bacterium]|nr:SDR family oxidoreductase [Bacteroidota bacterium]